MTAATRREARHGEDARVRYVLTLRTCRIGGRRFRPGAFARCIAAEARLLVDDAVALYAIVPPKHRRR